MPYLQVNGDSIYYEIQKGTLKNSAYDAIIFLHSLGTDHRIWKYQLAELNEDAPLLVTIDAKGHGESSANKEITIDTWVQDILEVIQTIQVKKVVLCGVSMGGIEAIAFAARYPEYVVGLVLADTFVKIDAVEEKIRLTASTARKQGMQTYANTYLDVTLSDSEAARDIRPELADAIAKMDVFSYQASVEACFRVDLVHVLADIQAPTLVLIGELDKKTPMALSEQIADHIPHSKLNVIPNACHLSNVDNPEGFNQQLIAFLRSL